MFIKDRTSTSFISTIQFSIDKDTSCSITSVVWFFVCRILKAGGARVVDLKLGTITSIRNIPRGLTHVFTELFYKEQLRAIANYGVHCVTADYIGDYLIQVMMSG